MAKKVSNVAWDGFAQRLKDARKKAGRTQLQLLAEFNARVKSRDGCGTATEKSGNSWLSNLESGWNRKTASMDELVLLARVLGVSVDWLIFGRNEGERRHALAIGVGGQDLEVLASEPGELVALWPGHWSAGPEGPPESMVVVFTKALREGAGWFAWRADRQWVVGQATLAAPQRTKIRVGQDGALMKAHGRVLMLIDPAA